MKLVTSKLITCVLPHGHGIDLVRRLKEEKDIVTANLHHARGVGRSTPLGWRAIGEGAERDILAVVVPEERADEIFSYLYFEGGIDRAHGGFIHQRTLMRSSAFELPSTT